MNWMVVLLKLADGVEKFFGFWKDQADDAFRADDENSSGRCFFKISRKRQNSLGFFSKNEL
jgi:hypothetical protein